MAREALPGGARFALTTSAIAVDLSAFAGYTVLLYCDEQDINLCFAPTNTSTTLVTSAQAASLTALVSKPVAKGTKFERRLGRDAKYAIVATQTSTGNLVVELVGRP